MITLSNRERWAAGKSLINVTGRNPVSRRFIEPTTVPRDDTIVLALKTSKHQLPFHEIGNKWNGMWPRLTRMKEELPDRERSRTWYRWCNGPFLSLVEQPSFFFRKISLYRFHCFAFIRDFPFPDFSTDSRVKNGIDRWNVLSSIDSTNYYLEQRQIYEGWFRVWIRVEERGDRIRSVSLIGLL